MKACCTSHTHMVNTTQHHDSALCYHPHVHLNIPTIIIIIITIITIILIIITKSAPRTL